MKRPPAGPVPTAGRAGLAGGAQAPGRGQRALRAHIPVAFAGFLAPHPADGVDVGLAFVVDADSGHFQGAAADFVLAARRLAAGAEQDVR